MNGNQAQNTNQPEILWVSKIVDALNKDFNLLSKQKIDGIPEKCIPESLSLLSFESKHTLILGKYADSLTSTRSIRAFISGLFTKRKRKPIYVQNGWFHHHQVTQYFFYDAEQLIQIIVCWNQDVKDILDSIEIFKVYKHSSDEDSHMFI
jgi:hypothetical protein